MLSEIEQTPKGLSAKAKKTIFFGLASAIAITVLVVCIVAPWRKTVPLEPAEAAAVTKEVTFDETKNKEYSPEPGTPEPPAMPDEQVNEQESRPPLSPSQEPAAGEEMGGSLYSKDSVLREAQNTHRSQLMRSAGKVNTGEPTTGSLMMNSMNTRVEGHGRFSQGSTAVMQRFTQTGSNSGEEEAMPIPSTQHSTAI